MPKKPTKNHGHLTTGVSGRTSDGRKIDTWTFRPGDVAGARDMSQAIEFTVAMLSTLDFVVDTKDIPRSRWAPLRGKLLADLHAQALDISRAEFDLRNDLTWTDWLEIRIEEAGNYKTRDVTASAQAFLSYSVIPRAEKPDGTAFTVNGNGVLVKFPEPVGVFRPSPEDADGWTGRRLSKDKEREILAASGGVTTGTTLGRLLNATDSRDPNTQFAYLPDTPENRAGLDSIIAAIDQVNVRLQAFLAPNEIVQTLARAALSGPRLLAGPEQGASNDAPSPPRRRSP